MIKRLILILGLSFIGLAQAETALDSLPLVTKSDFQYTGGFRLKKDTYGASRIASTNGSMSLNSDTQSFFITGHTRDLAIAEFPIPMINASQNLSEMPIVEPIQAFSQVIQKAPSGNPDNLNRITGMKHINGELWVNLHDYYDAGNDAVHTTLILENASNLQETNAQGFYQLDSRAHSSGWISEIPSTLVPLVGGTYMFGHSSGDPITTRFSVGPSAFSVTPNSLSLSQSNPTIATETLLDFPFENALDKDLFNESGNNSLWTHLSDARFGFIIPGTRTYATIGNSGGHESGVGYKITQDNGYLCGGYCSFDSNDNYSYFWLWDLADLIKVKNGDLASYEVKPYEFGKFTTPIDKGPNTVIIGGDYDYRNGVLYLVLSNADDMQGQYDTPPVMLKYKIGSLSSAPVSPSNFSVSPVSQ